ncbi:methyltransferase type 11 [Mycobacterium scrofulaceum]|uniref:methyltransferase type 11 n=1 Tax=Mycobacterium scrofulaceum TaxID=1783 RepID=UPI000B1E5D57|nr:methyltransferase type 11 [Mycobacterium scrofulaceum]
MTTTPPVILMIFNRPDTTRAVFETIRAAKPEKLLVIADGPRPNKPGEAENCAAARAIIDEVDWDCDVQKNFSETNMGTCPRVSSGITWAFELVEKAIILEDDCVASPSFFQYCGELLDRYENDERVMMISGGNHLFGHAETSDSYYFSRYPHIWGWATWRRAWAHYDVGMTRWPEIRDRKLFDQYFPKLTERYHWEGIFEYIVYRGRVDTWAWRWFYSIWANSGLCATPARNLVRNVGFDADATHTHAKWDRIYEALAADELDMPLTHPAAVIASSDLDELEAKVRSTYHSKGLLWVTNKLLELRVLGARTIRGIKSR